MKTSKTLVKTLATALLAVAGLSGCVAVPYGQSTYDPYGGGPVVYSPPVVVQPYVGIGFGYRRGYRRHW